MYPRHYSTTTGEMVFSDYDKKPSSASGVTHDMVINKDKTPPDSDIMDEKIPQNNM